MRARHADILEQIVTTGTLPGESDLEAAIVEFKRGFGPSDASPAGGATGPAEPRAAGAAGPAELRAAGAAGPLGATEAIASVVGETEAE
jgi:hypothetical protein